MMLLLTPIIFTVLLFIGILWLRVNPRSQNEFWNVIVAGLGVATISTWVVYLYVHLNWVS